MNQKTDRQQPDPLVAVSDNTTDSNFDYELWLKAVKQQMLAVMRKKKAKY